MKSMMLLSPIPTDNLVTTNSNDWDDRAKQKFPDVRITKNIVAILVTGEAVEANITVLVVGVVEVAVMKEEA